MSRVVKAVTLLMSFFISITCIPKKCISKDKLRESVLPGKKTTRGKDNSVVKRDEISLRIIKQKKKIDLINGIMALRGHFRHVNKTFAERIVNEAIEVTSMPGNSWMPVHDLIGLAINESDLRTWLETGPRHRADCGITQNHTPLFAYSFKKRRRLCENLKRSTKLSFIYAMKEMNMIKKRTCSRYYQKLVKYKRESQRHFILRMKRYQAKRYRCLFNTYNQGPKFLRLSCKERIDKKKYTTKQYWKRIYRCRYRNLYWLRSLCFATGLVLSKKPSRSCRGVWSQQRINRIYGVK